LIRGASGVGENGEKLILIRHYFTLVRAASATAVGNSNCVNGGRPHPHHTDGDTSFFRHSNQTLRSDADGLRTHRPRRKSFTCGEVSD
jgi:hypothetical protein